MYVWQRDELSFPNDVGPIFAAYQFLSTKNYFVYYWRTHRLFSSAKGGHLNFWGLNLGHGV